MAKEIELFFRIYAEESKKKEVSANVPAASEQAGNNKK